MHVSQRWRTSWHTGCLQWEYGPIALRIAASVAIFACKAAVWWTQKSTFSNPIFFCLLQINYRSFALYLCYNKEECFLRQFSDLCWTVLTPEAQTLRQKCSVFLIHFHWHPKWDSCNGSLYTCPVTLIAEDTSHQDVVAAQGRVKVPVKSLCCSGSSVSFGLMWQPRRPTLVAQQRGWRQRVLTRGRYYGTQ